MAGLVPVRGRPRAGCDPGSYGATPLGRPERRPTGRRRGPPGEARSERRVLLGTCPSLDLAERERSCRTCRIAPRPLPARLASRCGSRKRDRGRSWSEHRTGCGQPEAVAACSQDRHVGTDMACRASDAVSETAIRPRRSISRPSGNLVLVFERDQAAKGSGMPSARNRLVPVSDLTGLAVAKVSFRSK